MLVAHLDQADATFGNYLGNAGFGIDGGNIKDRVERWKRQRHPVYFAETAIERSIKCVSNFPAAKSGSARMRLCSGIVVFTPSTTKPPSAPCMRAMASERSRPCAMIFAISES